MSDDLEAARLGDERAFERLVAPFRRELKAHCYRLLGSPQDAEDAVQESLLAAWRGLAGFSGQSSLRTWLYRVTTNAALRLIEQRPKRLRSMDYAPSRTATADLGEMISGPHWLEPCLDQELGVDPSSRFLERESVELAFVAALQHLPGLQRAAVMLREVLEFSAEETAELLGTTVPSVNSALQRARKTLDERAQGPTQRAELAALGDDGQRELVRDFLNAWERADLEALSRMFTADVRFTMPPLPAWFDGRTDVLRFFSERVFAWSWSFTPLRCNGQLGFCAFMKEPGGVVYQRAGINLLAVRSGQIIEIASFLDPELCNTFGLPAELP